jgi:CheY-like chemotaxis protein
MPYKLLLADDSVTIQRVIELTFADEDVIVTAVGDGRQAIERIEADRPDIVLADVGMPERDGYEVAAYVKNTPHLSHIPVLLLTGAFEPIDEQRAHEVNCDGVLAKPFEPQMVIARVRELLPASGSRPSPVAADSQAPAPVSFEEPVAGGGQPAAVPGPEPEVSGDTDVRIRRRPPVQAFGVSPSDYRAAPAAAPAAPGGESGPVDEYFERLDAAFASLGRLTEHSAGPAVTHDEDLSDRTLYEPAANAEPAADALIEPAAARDADATLRVPPAEVPTAPDAVVPEPERSPVAQAFSALLAAERGDDQAASVSPLWASPVLSAEAMDEIVERVTRDVLERMSDRAVRETVTDVVSRIAERLVRDEIERVKASIK